MPFDPSKPYEAVDQPQASGFDPSQPFEEVKQGGELTNVQDQTRASTDRNARREGNEQVGNRNETLNASGKEPRILQERGSLYPSEGRGQEAKDQLTSTGFDPSKPFEEVEGGEISSEKGNQINAQGSEGKKDGQGLRSQSDARNKEEVVGGMEGVQPSPKPTPPKERGIAEIGLAGFNEKAYKYASAAVGAMSITPKGMAAATEAVFGKNKYSDKLRSAPEEVQSYLSGLAKYYGLNETENKSMLDGLVHGTTGGLVDLVAIPLTEGAGLIAKAPIADASANALKAIYDKSVHGIQAFSIPSAVAMDSAIKESKANGASDQEALAEGVKTLISTEAGAALPLQVSSGLSNMAARGASRILQSVPLVLAQQEIAQTIQNMMSKKEQQVPTFSQNVISGNLKDAEKQLVESAPMALLGAAGQSTYRKGPQIAGKEEIAKIHEASLPQTANEIESQQAEQVKGEVKDKLAAPADGGVLGGGKKEVEAPKVEEEQPPSEPQASRLQKAAYIATNKKGQTKIFTGENHDEALDNALDEKFITPKEHAKLKGDKNAYYRNSKEFGFLDQNGEFHDRKTAKQIAEQAGQLNTNEFAYQDTAGNPLLHSHEVELDKYMGGGHGEIETSDLHGKTIKEALNFALEHESASPKIKAVIKALLGTKSEKLDGDIVQAVIKEGEKAKDGESDLKGRRVDNEVHIPENGKVEIKVLLHEALHTHTAEELYKYFPSDGAKNYKGKSYVDWLTRKSSGASVPAPIKRIVKLYKSYLEQASKTKDANIRNAVEQYGDMNIHEFISEGFSNDRFQATLRTLKGDGQKSLFKSIVDSLKQMLRIKEGSMLESVLQAGLDIGDRSGEKGVGGVEESADLPKKKWGAGIGFFQKKGQIVRESIEGVKAKAAVLRQELKSSKPSAKAYEPAKGFVESPKGKNVMSAAYRNPADGKIYEGPSHQSAMESAGVEKETNPDNFGYYTNLGEFISSKQAKQIAKESKRLKPSGDIELTGFYKSGEKAGERKAEPISFSERPADAVMQQFMMGVDSFVKDKDVAAEIKDAMQGGKTSVGLKAYTELQNTMRKIGLTHDDLDALGINLPETAMKARIVESMKSGIMQFVDFFDNKITPKLQKAGATIESRAYAASPELVNRKADMLLAKVFPEWYKNESHAVMKKVMSFMVKDNILGGYDKAKEHLATLREKYANPEITEKQQKNLGKAITKQANFIKAIEEVRDIEKLNEEVEGLKNDPDVVKAVDNWKTHVTPVMEELYRNVKGLRPDEEIPEGLIEESRGRHSGARINLLPEAGIEKLMDYFDNRKTEGDGVDVTSFQSPEVANFQNPNVKRDNNSVRANFLGNYSEDPKLILLNSLGSRYQNAAKINLYRKLVDTGFAYMVEKGEAGPKLINGKPVYKMPAIKFPFFNYETGETDLREVNYFTQADMRGEIEQLLDVNTRFSNMPVLSTISKALNATQMVGIADGVAHLLNIHRVATAALGKDSFGKDIMGKIPVYSSVKTIKELRDLCKEASMDSPAWREEVSKLADLGLIRSTHPAEGFVQRFIGIHDMIHDADLAARVFMSRKFDQMVKRGLFEDTKENKINFVSQVGEYNSRLNGRFLQALKDTGLSPFMTAGRAMTRASIRLLTGSAGARAASDKANLQIRAANLMGLVFATTLPMTINMFTTGSAFGRKGVPIGAIDFGPKADTEDGKHRILDIFQLVGLRRAMRALGINSAIEGFVNGLPMDRISLNMKNDVFTTIAHPFVGPAAGFLVEGTTGNRIDLRTGYGQSFSARKIDNEWGQLAENFRVAVKHLNPLAYGLLQGPIQKGMESMGIPKDADETTSAQATGEALIISPAAAAGLNLKGVVSPATKLANQLGQKVQYTPEQSIRYQARKNVNELVKAGKFDEAGQIYNQYKHDGVLRESDDRILKMNFKEQNPLVLKVRGLKTADDAIQVYRVATPEEQDAIKDVVGNKIKNSSVLLPEEQRKRYDMMFQYAKKGSQIHSLLNQ